MAKRAVKKKGANGYKLPDPLPKGEILIDIAKKKWILGDSIGQGGFGEIYSAKETDSKSSTYPYVVKIEPHENGPLFVEINFYIRNAKSQDVEEFKTKKKLKTIGMPTYIGSGSHEHKDQKYRFLVMHKFGSDIWKLFLKDKVFPTATVFKLAFQILDVLEYIHERGYVHADIKGANILLGLDKEAQHQVYLVDFGLATKYQTGTEFKPNPKRAHDGTIEYLSRDAHLGVPTRRGDLEILAYNIIQWLGGTLPWEKNLTNPVTVQQSKEEYMSDPEKLLKKSFGSKKTPQALKDYLKIVQNLDTKNFDKQPDYAAIRKLFIKEIENQGEKLTSPFSFNVGKSPNKRMNANERVQVKRVKKDEVDDEIDEAPEEVVKETKKTKKPAAKEGTGKAQKKTKQMDKPVEEEEIDEFQGYTAEMKALALKKAKTVTKKKPKNEPNGVLENGIAEEKASENSIPNTVRSRRNLKVVNYKESPK